MRQRRAAARPPGTAVTGPIRAQPVESADALAVAGVARRTRLPPFLRRPFRVSVVRPEDFLVLEFEFRNLRLAGGRTPRLIRIDDGRPAYLIAWFPPQHVAEEAFYETDKTGGVQGLDPARPDPPDQGPSVPPVQARLAGPSRLVFVMPDDLASLKYTSEALLDACATWPLSLAPGALPNPPPERRVRLGGRSRLSDAIEQALAGIARDVADRTAGAVAQLLLEHVAGAVKQELTRAVRDAGLAGRVDVEPLVDETVRTHVSGLEEGAAEAVAALDAESLVSFVDRGVASVAAESIRRLGPLERELGAAVDLGLIIGRLLAPAPPADAQTAIELPWRLLLSPNRHATWVHSLTPVTHAGRTELWHTRLGIREEAGGEVTEGQHRQRTLRAIWSPDYGQPSAQNHYDLPFRQSLDARDRQLLVQVTAGFDIPGYTPRPAYANQLMLTSLGAWLDTEGSWAPPAASGIELEAWKHRAAMARDTYVRVVYAGFLFPFGHRASLIKVTERKFTPTADGQVAYLWQRYFIVVREPVRTYPGAGQPFAGRQLPFTEVRIATTVTPNLDPPGVGDGLDGARAAAAASKTALFWPFVGSRPFEFHLVARDAAENDVDFTTPLIFVSKEKGLPFDQGRVATIIGAYASSPLQRRQRPVGGRTVRFAQSAKPGDTDLETVDLTFGGQLPGLGLPSGAPRFYPTLEQASVRVPALQRLLGAPSLAVRYPGAGNPSSVADHQYLKSGFGGANSGEVFLEAVPSLELAVRFGTGNHGDKAGGLVNPDLTLRGLSRSVGPVGGSDIQKAATAQFDPADFFAGATFLGGISLGDVLKLVGGFNVPGNEELVPRMTFTDDGTTAVTELRWKTSELRSDGDDLFRPHEGGTSELEVSTRVKATAAGPPESTTHASLTNFKVNLFGFLILWFDRIEFTAVQGRKAEPDVALHPTDPVTFGGPLEFVNELRRFIPSDGFSDAPDVQVRPDGLTSGYSLALPSIAVGIFSLENVKLGSSFVLPFNGDKTVVRFNFAERHDTFVLTVSAFGGGGFLALALNSDGMQELEAALEFTGSVSINLGVASGGVYVKAGIYYHWQIEKAELSGYVEVGGSLSVIGLITVSLVFHMSLTYTTAGKIWGQATLVVEVEILCFSQDVSVTVERQFKGSAGDPAFAELYSQTDWNEYCGAFASEAA